jgi:ceramide glucosyltransferase
LERIGGFISVVDHLADDYELGERIAALGLKVELSDVVVETFLPAYRFKDFFAHQIRWSRGMRDVRSGGYLGLVSTFGIAWALLALAASKGSAWSWVALAFTLLLRLTVATTVGVRVLRDQQLLKDAWLIPLRDLIAVAVWVVSLGGDTVTWRGERFRLSKGKLTRVAN